jgi:Protein of unknown function (DUF1488)
MSEKNAEDKMDDKTPHEPHLSADGSQLIFIAAIRGKFIDCAITRRALEECFWAPVNATEAQLRKAYVNGRSRIVAGAERKFLRAPSEEITLDVADFVISQL